MVKEPLTITTITEPFTITLVEKLIEEPVYEPQPQPRLEKPKDLPKTAIKIDEAVVCPFCLCRTFKIGSHRIECYKCGTLFDKKLIIGKNVYSINMNLRFLHDLYKAGVEEERLGIRFSPIT